MSCGGGKLALSVALLLLASAARAQDDEKPRPDDRIKFDFSFDYDPEELRETIDERIRWKRIVGPLGVAGYHVFPAQRTGANLGPPREIWTNGWGTSMWRDPVTGWPLQ